MELYATRYCMGGAARLKPIFFPAFSPVGQLWALRGCRHCAGKYALLPPLLPIHLLGRLHDTGIAFCEKCRMELAFFEPFTKGLAVLE